MKLEAIWGLYRTSLKSFLHSKISNPSDVEDLLQEVLLKTYHSINDLKQEDSIKPWLFQIANRSVIDFYRQQGLANAIAPNTLWQEETESNLMLELAQCIEPFLNALPEDSANLLRDIDLAGRSQKTYADELGLSYSTLKSRVQKARLTLKTLFKDCCDYQLDKHGNLIDFEQKSVPCKKC